MNRLTRLSCAVLTVAALGCSACSADTTPKDGATTGTASAPSNDKATTTASPNAPLFTKSVHIGAKTDQPGFNTQSAGKHEYFGFETQLAQYLGEKLGFEARLDDVPSIEREAWLLDGSVELVIATYSITQERLNKIDFVGPYMQTRQGLLVLKDNKDIKTREDTAGKEICTVQGSTSAPGSDSSGSALQKNNPLNKDADFTYELDYKACVEQLVKHNVDAVWTDKVILYGFTADYPVKVVKNIEVGKNQLYGIGLAKGQPAKCKALKAQLKNFMKTDWLSDFRARFPEVVAADQNFEADYKPRDDEIDRQTSCA